MIAFTYGSAHSNPRLTGFDVIIKKRGRNSTPTKITKAVKCMGSRYEGKLEAKK